MEDSGGPRGAPQIPPLRYASVGMTILFGNAKYSFQDELSSRPKRSRISCRAALDKAPRVRPSVKKGACGATTPTSSTGNPGERSGGICGAPLGLPESPRGTRNFVAEPNRTSLPENRCIKSDRWAAPIFFGPRTLVRTWGTRRFPLRLL
jgi:hypothetical protein